MALGFGSGELAVVGVLDGAAKLRSQVVLPFLYSGEGAVAVFSGVGWVSFSPPPNNFRRVWVHRSWIGGVFLLRLCEGM